jgi:heme exporter protein C
MEKTPRLLTFLTILSLVLLAVALYMVFVYAPVEAVMGLVQKVFYFHVANAWGGMVAFIVASVAGVVYLRSSDIKWDVIGLASVELGMVMMLIAIISGSIWAQPIWNTWWTWDPRLTTVTIMELVYAAYLMLRQGIDEPERRARFGAIYAIVGMITVPLTFFSIRFARTIHPVIIGSGDPTASGAFEMTAPMQATFFFSLFTFTVISITLLWYRVRLGMLAQKVEYLKIETAVIE